jgi:hypothetical protein
MVEVQHLWSHNRWTDDTVVTDGIDGIHSLTVDGIRYVLTY